MSPSSSPRSSQCVKQASSACCSFSFLPTSRPTPNVSATSSSRRRFEQQEHHPSRSSFVTIPGSRDEIYAIMREHNAALCIAESDDLATPEVHTAISHTSFRLRRNSGYSPAELDVFAARFAALAEQRDVYVYFKHEDDPTGALNASAFLERVRAQNRAEAGTP